MMHNANYNGADIEWDDNTGGIIAIMEAASLCD